MDFPARHVEYSIIMFRWFSYHIPWVCYMNIPFFFQKKSMSHFREYLHYIPIISPWESHDIPIGHRRGEVRGLQRLDQLRKLPSSLQALTLDWREVGW